MMCTIEHMFGYRLVRMHVRARDAMSEPHAPASAVEAAGAILRDF